MRCAPKLRTTRRRVFYTPTENIRLPPRRPPTASTPNRSTGDFRASPKQLAAALTRLVPLHLSPSLWGRNFRARVVAMRFGWPRQVLAFLQRPRTVRTPQLARGSRGEKVGAQPLGGKHWGVLCLDPNAGFSRGCRSIGAGRTRRSPRCSARGLLRRHDGRPSPRQPLCAGE